MYFDFKRAHRVLTNLFSTLESTCITSITQRWRVKLFRQPNRCDVNHRGELQTFQWYRTQMRLHGWNTHEQHWIYLISLVVELILQTETQISIKIRIEHFSSVFASLLCSCQIEWFVHSGISVVWFTLICLYFVFITFDFHLMTTFG